MSTKEPTQEYLATLLGKTIIKASEDVEKHGFQAIFLNEGESITSILRPQTVIMTAKDGKVIGANRG